MSFARFWKYSLVLLSVVISLNVSTAQIKLKGTVIDSSTAPLIAATVVLLQPADSVMVSFAITDNQGGFVLNKIDPGQYYLQITYIGYGNFRQDITIDPEPFEQDLGTIFLSPKNTLLEQVVVKGEHVPIVIKKDTIEYNADAFKVKQNAMVEDLLKRLPGVDVERDGTIKAQGEDVENVLVDGKEFFGKDPKIATQNLPADVVDKVQVFDKKSEMAEFSGIDDGNEEKTINLALKEDKKQGYFGNIKGGFGTEDFNQISGNERYQGKLSINRFDHRLQFSLLGMANNVNDEGFSFNDYINFMGGWQNFMSGGKMNIEIDSRGGIPFGYAESPGITHTAAGGLNFNYDFNDKTEWQSSYFINRIENNTIQSISSQNLAGDKTFSQLEDSNRDNTNLNHRLNTTLRYKGDSTIQMTWINRLSFNTRDFQSISGAETFNIDNQLENKSAIEFMEDGEQFSWTSDLTIRKRLNKPGRILTGNVSLTLGNADNIAFVDNKTDLFLDGNPHFTERVLQDQISDDQQTQYGIRLSFTEPIGNKTYLSLILNRNNYRNERLRDYYDLDPSVPSSRTYNSFLSNQYVRDYIYNSVGSNFKINRKKFKFNGGISLQLSELKGDILSENEQLEKNFTYFLPSFSIDYDFETSKNLNFSYRTRIQEPSLDQLQPLVNNSNPLYIYQGNPDLKPEYVHETNLHLVIFDQFSFTSFFANLRNSYTRNRIVDKNTIDESFRQIVTPINVDHDWNTNLYANFSTPLRFIKSKISVDANTNYNRGILFINELENNTNRWTNNITLTLENRKKEVVDAAIGTSLGTNSVSYSESEAFNQSYFDQTYFTDLSLYLPNSWVLESSFDYTRYSEETFGDQDDQAIWKASLSKSFLSKDQATLELSVFDILNQNQGINRSNSGNYIQESRTNVLGRYVMLSFNYRLAQFGALGGMEVHHKRRR